MFNGCSSLTKIDLSMLNTANVTTMQMLFDDCINLTSVNMKGLNTAKVTDTRAMFYNCSALKNLDLSDFNGASLTAMALTLRMLKDKRLQNVHLKSRSQVGTTCL